LPDEAHRIIARRIFLRLVQFGEGRPDTRRQQRRSQLENRIEDKSVFDATLDHLIAARLLVAGDIEQPTADNPEQQRTQQETPIDIAHERLITGWPTFQWWLKERRATEQIRRRLEGKAEEWVRLGGAEGGRLDEIELREAQNWLTDYANTELGASEDLRKLVFASAQVITKIKVAEEAAKQEQIRQANALAEEQKHRADDQTKAARKLQRQLQALIGAAVLALIAAITATIFYSEAQKNSTEAERQLAEGQLSEGDALRSAGRWEKAQRITEEAYQKFAQAKMPMLEVELGLWSQHELSPPCLLTYSGHTSEVTSVAFSPDGLTALSGSQDKTLKLWDVATGRNLRTFYGHAGGVCSVAYTPDSRMALSGSGDCTLKLWDIVTGKEVRTFIGSKGPVYCVAISPDGKTAISGSYDKDNILRLWDLATGKELRIFKGHNDTIPSVAFSPKDHTLLSCSWDDSLKLWDLNTGELKQTFKDTNHVECVAISPDGRTALSGDFDFAVKLWDLATGAELHTFLGCCLLHRRPYCGVLQRRQHAETLGSSERQRSTDVRWTHEPCQWCCLVPRWAVRALRE
jgi:WD40 repeat protein